MADVQGILNDIFELLWTILKVHYELFKGIWRTFVPLAPKDVENEVVLITGTGHGIGREVAIRFARLGAIVVGLDINTNGNEETARIIKAEKGRIHTYQCDVTDRAAVMQLADKIRRDVGEVSILINNAGIMPCNPILQQTEKEIRLMNDININANLWTIQAFLPSMMERNHGHIVALSSMAGLMGLRNLVPYCGSKFAVRGIMEALHTELRDDPRKFEGIKFTTICPYIVDTGLCKKPRSRFQKMIDVVSVAEAADTIVDAVRRELLEITIPHYMHFTSRYILWLLPFRASHTINSFLNAGVDPHD